MGRERISGNDTPSGGERGMRIEKVNGSERENGEG